MIFSVLLICMAFFESAISECGTRYFYGPSGEISSPNYPSHYANSLDCYNYIDVPSAQTIFITFRAFSTESCCDYVKIACESGSGFDSSSNYGHDLPPVMIITSCKRVRVHFHSDGSTTYPGFSLNYYTTSDCGTKYFTGLSGEISSQNYPTRYTNNLDCYNYISVTSGHAVIITFLAFETESLYDWVTIACESGNAFRSERFSGSRIPAALTIFSCSLINVHFHTNYNTTYTGFSLTYNVTSGCDNAYFSEPYGTVSSPNYPNAYSSNLDCYSYIAVSAGQTISIEFLEFNTQSVNDWVTISCTSGNAFTSPRYSGSDIPADLLINSCGIVQVHFHSDLSINSGGFSLSYNIASGCENVYFSEPFGTVSSPNYPNAYSNNLDCYSYIAVSSGHKVNIAFLEFDTQSVNDWVTISCTSGNAFTSPRYSGSDIPADLMINTCGIVQVHFHTDLSINSGGFSLSYNIASGCDNAYFSEPYGTVSSPNYPSAYSNNLDCYSYIAVSSGHKVNIGFLEFNTQPNNDWVTIACTSGNSFTSPRYSGSDIPEDMTINSCSIVQVHFHADLSNNSAGFNLTYNIIPESTYQPQRTQVAILGFLFGLQFVIIIVILAIPHVRKFLLLKRNTAAVVCQECDNIEYELQHKVDEDDIYENAPGKPIAVAASEYADLDALQRRHPVEPAIYQELVAKK